MAKPIVAIVGRPNVGKSTLFNKLVGQRLSIVEDTPGVTRDRIYGNCEWQDKRFLLVDTGGIEPDNDAGLLAHIRQQAELAIDTAQCIILVTDIRSGVTASDTEIARMLIRSGKPVVLAVNKCDSLGAAGTVRFLLARHRGAVSRLLGARTWDRRPARGGLLPSLV